MLTKTYIANSSSKCRVLLLSPVSVAFDYKNQGVGSALIRESLRLAKEMSYMAVFLIGDPDYYSRFGFNPTVNYDIRHIRNIPAENVMVCELYPGSLAGVGGTIDIV